VQLIGDGTFNAFTPLHIAPFVLRAFACFRSLLYGNAEVFAAGLEAVQKASC
jgi:hypothetical protein